MQSSSRVKEPFCVSFREREAPWEVKILTPFEHVQRDGKLADEGGRLINSLVSALAREVYELITREASPIIPHRRKQVWTCGIKAAAIYIIDQLKKEGQSAGQQVIQMCRKFLTDWEIEGHPAYRPELLANHVYKYRTLY